jgi:hypothetical protein
VSIPPAPFNPEGLLNWGEIRAKKIFALSVFYTSDETQYNGLENPGLGRG